MAVIAFESSFNPILDNDGNPAAGAKLYFRNPGTLDAKSVYSSADLMTGLEDPTIMDGNGRRVVFLSGDYDLLIEDSLGNQLSQISNINPDSAGAATGLNLIDNGSFELNTSGDGKTPDSWVLTEETGGTADLNSDSIIGSQAMKFTAAGATGGGNVISENFFEVAGGDILTVTFWLKSSVATVRNLVQLHWYDSSQALISSDSIYDLSTGNPTSYTRQLLAVTAPSNARFGKIQMYGCHPSDPTNGDTFFDGVEVISSSLGSSFISGTKMVFCQATAPAGWTYDAETTDRVLMFRNAAAGTEAGSWTISGLSGTQPRHTHTDNLTIANHVPGVGYIGGVGPNFYATTHNHAINGSVGSVSSGANGQDPVTVTHSAGWRPTYRVVRCGTRD